ncbi:calcium-binding and coiled-coil domain-containing protein 2 [Rhynchocyon petersi]
MEETIDDAPISAVVLDHCHFAQVIFNSVEKFYVPGGDITCYYTLTQHFIPRRKDWIGIFRVGWKTTREYYTFMWVTLPADLNNESPKEQQVQFKAYYLPKDDEYYQFCYVDQEGVVRGASIPFQFRPESEDDILVVSTQGQMEELDQRNKELCKENQELKENCVSLQKQNLDMQTELQKMQGLQEELEMLKNINKKLDQNMKEQKVIQEIELLQLKEQNQMMSSENEKMAVRIDKLQAQLLTQEKEMEKQKLILGDQENSEQLKHLKMENEQLSLILNDQVEHQKKLEQRLNELEDKETTAAKKQQELMDKNVDLCKRLSDSELKYETLQKAKEKVEGENDLLKKENSRLLRYMRMDSESLPHQVPASAQGGTCQTPGLVYGNPYCEFYSFDFFLQDRITPKLDCEVMHAVHPWHQPLRTHFFRCPVCKKRFPFSQRQIFDDHVLCHSYGTE